MPATFKNIPVHTYLCRYTYGLSTRQWCISTMGLQQYCCSTGVRSVQALMPCHGRFSPCPASCEVIHNLLVEGATGRCWTDFISIFVDATLVPSLCKYVHCLIAFLLLLHVGTMLGLLPRGRISYFRRLVTN